MARKPAQESIPISRDEINRLYETVNRGVDTLQKGIESLDIALREFRVESKMEYIKLDERIRALENERITKKGEKDGFFAALKMLPLAVQVVFWFLAALGVAKMADYLTPDEQKGLAHVVETTERLTP